MWFIGHINMLHISQNNQMKYLIASDTKFPHFLAHIYLLLSLTLGTQMTFFFSNTFLRFTWNFYSSCDFWRWNKIFAYRITFWPTDKQIFWIANRWKKSFVILIIFQKLEHNLWDSVSRIYLMHFELYIIYKKRIDSGTNSY